VSTSTIISNFRSHASPIRSRDYLLLLLSCCCIWLSGPGSQDLSFRTSIFGSQDWWSQTVVIDIWLSRLTVTGGQNRSRAPSHSPGGQNQPGAWKSARARYG
jgi:hypothetical protein